MKKSTSRMRRLFLTKNFILMLVMLVLIIVAISAWFSFNKTVNANGIVVKSVSTEIDIAPCIKYYDPTYTNIVSDGPGEFGDSVTFRDFTLTKDCTGDGNTLIVPEFNVTKDYNSVRLNGGKEVNTNLGAAYAMSNEASRIAKLKNPTADAPEYQYIEFEFYVRSKNKGLLLQSDSQVLSVTEAQGGTLSSAPSSEKKSAYGNFNVDALVGAIRVSLIGEGCTSVTQNWDGALVTEGERAPNSLRGNPVKQILWNPRPDIKLHIPTDEDDITNWSILTNQTSGETFTNSYYRTINNNSAVELVKPDNDSKTVTSSATDSNGVRMLGDNVNISDFSSYETDPPLINLVVSGNDTSVTDNYYVTKYTMRVWIEGTDTEARRAMDGGQFNITLNFL